MAIVSCLVDTNVLLRATRRADPEHQLVGTALVRLSVGGTTLHYTLQNIVEFWNVMTRPIARNGLGLTVEDAEREGGAIEAGMTLLPDGDAVYREKDRRAIRNLRGAGPRRASGSIHVCARRQSHSHVEPPGFQPLRRHRGFAPEHRQQIAFTCCVFVGQ